MSEKGENPSVEIDIEEKEAFDTAGQSRMVGMEKEKVDLDMSTYEPVGIDVEENMDGPTILHRHSTWMACRTWQLAEHHFEACLPLHHSFLHDEFDLFLGRQ